MFDHSLAIKIATGIIFVLCIDIFHRLRGPKDIPIVRSRLPLASLVSGFAFFFKRSSWLQECRKFYGNSYMFSVGAQNIVVLSERTTLKAMYGDRGASLDAKGVYYRILCALGIHCTRDKLDVPVHEHFLPSLNYVFSKKVIAKDLKIPFHHELHARFRNLATMTHPFILSHVIGCTLYEPLTAAFFGPTMPLDTYNDYLILDAAIPILMGPLPFLSRSGIHARERLLKVFVSYVRDNGKNDGPEAEALSHSLKSAHSGSLSVEDQAVLILGLHWALHSNLHRAIFWLVAFILVECGALERLCTEVRDTIAKKYGGSLDGLLALEGNSLLPDFPLVDSAIKESLRMAALSTSMREVEFDTRIISEKSSFVIRRGDLVFGDTRAIHCDDTVYPDASTYKVDRFMAGNVRAPNILAWGGGEHICKGRFLAQYVMKVWLIMLLEMYDISSSITNVPEISPKSWNAMADPVGDIKICLHRRNIEVPNDA